MKVMFCCRDEHGNWLERATAVDFAGGQAVVHVWPFDSLHGGIDGVPFAVGGDGFVLGWRWFPAIKRRRMVGNCMWDSVEMSREDATRLFVYLAELGGDVEVAPTEWFERFNRLRAKRWPMTVSGGEQQT